MKVILQQDVKAQGKKGQLIDVSDGYARNFLLPRGLAIEATSSAVNVMKTQQEAKNHHKEVEIENAKKLAQRLNEISVTIPVKGGASGKIYGSVTSKEISQVLLEKEKIDIDKRKIVLNDTIKNYGEYTAVIKLYPEISANIKIIVCEA